MDFQIDMEYPNSDEEDQPPYKGHRFDPQDAVDRDDVYMSRSRDLAQDRRNPNEKVRRNEAIRKGKIPRDQLSKYSTGPYGLNRPETELSEVSRLKRATKGNMLLSEAETPEEARIINERWAYLDRTKKPDQRRRLDQQWIKQQNDPQCGVQCAICNKIDVPLYHCGECMDATYCGNKCRTQGCGYKH